MHLSFDGNQLAGSLSPLLRLVESVTAMSASELAKSFANACRSKALHFQAPLRQASANGTKWSTSSWEAFEIDFPSYELIHWPPTILHFGPILGFKTASSMRTSVRVLHPSLSASIQCLNLLLSYPSTLSCATINSTALACAIKTTFCEIVRSKTVKSEIKYLENF